MSTELRSFWNIQSCKKCPSLETTEVYVHQNELSQQKWRHGIQEIGGLMQEGIGSSLIVQWLGLSAFIAMTVVQFLVGEL